MQLHCQLPLQARPAEHHHEMDYFGTLGRKLQQGPPGTVPEGIEATQPDAAMSPMSAPGMPETFATIRSVSICQMSNCWS